MKRFFVNLKKAWKYEKQNKMDIILFCIFQILMLVIRILVPLISAKKIIYLTSNTFERLLYISIVLFAVESSYNVFRYFSDKHLHILYTESHKRIAIDLGKSVLRLDNDCLDKNASGKFVQRLTNDASKIADIFAGIILYLSEIVREIGIYIALISVSIEIFLSVAIVLILKTILERVRTTKNNELDKEWRKENDKISTFSSEMVRGARDVKMLNSEKGFISRLKKDMNVVNEIRYQRLKKNRTYIFFRGMLSDLEDLILIFLIVYLITNNRLDITFAIVAYNYYNSTGGFATNIGYLLEKIKDFNLSADRTFELFDDNKYSKEKFGNKHLDKVKGNFEFKNVSFNYGTHEVLKNISFKVKERETVAFVGKSGSGKTTIFNLLCKMYDVKDGSIFIDGFDINSLDRSSIRGNITVISQSPYIFNLSIFDNFKLIKNNVTLNEVKKACEIACLSDYIESLPDKYNSIIGEGGVNLSGGEKQRFAIARALIQKTQIILFDEATSALDNETQDRITTAINNMKNDYTILIIAHRLSTVKNADRILYLEDGVIKAEGSHIELLKKCEGYKKLYEKELKK